MARNGMVVTKLSDLVDGQEATCFAALVKKTRAFTRANQPYIKCLFRDKRIKLEAMLWSDHSLLPESENWIEGECVSRLGPGKIRSPLRHADRSAGDPPGDR